MTKFKLKTPVEAYQLTFDNVDEIREFLGAMGMYYNLEEGGVIFQLPTEEGDFKDIFISFGDYVISNNNMFFTLGEITFNEFFLEFESSKTLTLVH